MPHIYLTLALLVCQPGYDKMRDGKSIAIYMAFIVLYFMVWTPLGSIIQLAGLLICSSFSFYDAVTNYFTNFLL